MYGTTPSLSPVIAEIPLPLFIYLILSNSPPPDLLGTGSSMSMIESLALTGSSAQQLQRWKITESKL